MQFRHVKCIPVLHFRFEVCINRNDECLSLSFDVFCWEIENNAVSFGKKKKSFVVIFVSYIIKKWIGLCSLQCWLLLPLTWALLKMMDGIDQSCMVTMANTVPRTTTNTTGLAGITIALTGITMALTGITTALTGTTTPRTSRHNLVPTIHTSSCWRHLSTIETKTGMQEIEQDI